MDAAAIKELKKYKKLSLDPGPGVELILCMKPVNPGDVVGRKRLLGYVQKGYGTSHYSLDNHNFSPLKFQEAANEYIAKSKDPFNGVLHFQRKKSRKK